MDTFERKAHRAVIDQAASSLAHAIRRGDAEAIELTQALLPAGRRRAEATGTVDECSSASSRT